MATGRASCAPCTCLLASRSATSCAPAILSIACARGRPDRRGVPEAPGHSGEGQPRAHDFCAQERWRAGERAQSWRRWCPMSSATIPLAFIAALPDSARLTFAGVRILLAHGTPWAISWICSQTAGQWQIRPAWCSAMRKTPMDHLKYMTARRISRVFCFCFFVVCVCVCVCACVFLFISNEYERKINN